MSLTLISKPLSTAAIWSDVAYGGGIYVATAQDQAIVAVSTDGASTWAEYPTGLGWGAKAVCYGNGQFLISRAGSAGSATSPDGITWTVKGNPASNIDALAYLSGSTFAGGAASFGAYFRSTNTGTSWTFSVVANAGWSRVRNLNGTLTALYGGNASYIHTSTNGTAWTQRSLPLSVGCVDAAYGAGVYLILASGGFAQIRMFRATDGVTYSEVTLPAGMTALSTGASLSYGGGYFFAAVWPSSGNVNTTEVWSSPDGTTWTRVQNGLYFSGFSAYGNTLVQLKPYYAEILVLVDISEFWMSITNSTENVL